jgi:hypothetical protein
LDQTASRNHPNQNTPEACVWFERIIVQAVVRGDSSPGVNEESAAADSAGEGRIAGLVKRQL